MTDETTLDLPTEHDPLPAAPKVKLIEGVGTHRARLDLMQAGSEHEFWQTSCGDYPVCQAAHKAGVEGFDMVDDVLHYLGRRVRPAG